jgi:hypothetical protein
MDAIGSWMTGKPRLSSFITKGHEFHLGRLPLSRLIFNRWVAWYLMAVIVLSITFLLNQFAQIVLILIVSPLVGVILLANILEMDEVLPSLFKFSRQRIGQVLVIVGVLLLIFLIVLGAEVLIIGPDLRTDGLHGILAPKVLGLSARPVMIYDLDEIEEPLGALYLGGNADLYVLYDPCKEIVRFIPVGSSRVEHIDQVTCR